MRPRATLVAGTCIVLLLGLAIAVGASQSGSGQPSSAQATTSEPTPSEPTLGERVDELFAHWDRNDAPGAVVAVIRDGEIVYSNAFGMADLERDVPLSTDSAFEIGSVSKQFTAMCVLLLAHDGALTLDDDVRDYISELPDYGETITLRHLLHHTSGVRDVETLIPLAGVRWVDAFSHQEQLALIARQRELNFEPNSRHLYSNSGYLLLALVVERVSGLSLADFAETRIFAPLGMDSTVFWERPEQLVPNRALAYTPVGEDDWGLEMWNLPFVGPAGLYTTIGDLARWDANFYDNRLGGGAELIELMETPGTLDGGDSVGYAAGLVSGRPFGLPSLSHSGAWMGYRAGVMRFPEQRLTTIVLSNAASLDVGSGRVARVFLSDVIESLASAGAAGGGGEGWEPPEAVSVPVEELASFSGAYWAEEAELLRHIEVRDGALSYVRTGGGATVLGALGDGAFFMTGLPFRVGVSFDTEAGTMTVNDGDDDLVFERVEVSANADYSELAGSYWSEELERALVVSVETGGPRIAWVGEQGRLAEPIRVDEFLAPAFIPVPWFPQAVRLVVERDAEGGVAALRMSSEMVSGIRLVPR